MAGFLVKVGVPLVALSALLYQTHLKSLLLLLVGLGRELEPLDDFPFTCRRIWDSRLAACEDMWLSESSRTLFLACSDPLSRQHWLPALQYLNASGRGLDDAIIAMDIDSPKDDSFDYQVLQTPGFAGVDGDGRLHLLGLTGAEKQGVQIDLYLINSRPSIDVSTGSLLDNAQVGANQTIERFSVDLSAGELNHVKTFADSGIATPNNIAWHGDDAFFFTNDHGPHKVGLQNHLSQLIGTGDVSYCNSTGCQRVATGYQFPNGLVKGHDGRIYVPSSVFGGIFVFEIEPDNGLKQVDYIEIPYPMDNLSVDADGNILAPAFPKLLQGTSAFTDPYFFPPATILKIQRTNEGYRWQKILEDDAGKVLGLTTAVTHDAKTGRLFLSGITLPFLTVCDPK